MIVAGSHESIFEAPNAPMFGAKRPRGQGGQNDLTDALTGMAKTIDSALKVGRVLPSNLHDSPH